MFGETMNCPKCGEECDRDSVDVGVGVIYGPWGCYCCGWSSSPEYDCSEGRPKAQEEMEGYIVDPFGGATPKAGMIEKLHHFGLDEDLIKDL